MSCDVSEEQLWSWNDRGDPKLEEHLATCLHCRKLHEELRSAIDHVVNWSLPPSVTLPASIGPYTIRRLLGEGGQAFVYEAEQQSTRRLVALKVLKGGAFIDECELRRFKVEVESLGRMDHRGIATIYDAGRSEAGQYFFAMKLVRGTPLNEYVRQNNVSLEHRLRLFRAICDAVHYAHRHHVVHRDLKPSNILIDAEGSPKLLDFGLARFTGSEISRSASSTHGGQILGTLAYMAPEQARGESSGVGELCDVYALGVILYEMVTGGPPYYIGTILPEAVAAICEKTPARPSSVNRALGRDLDAICLKALEKEPSRRYASVADLGEDVHRFLDNQPVVARGPSRLYALRKKAVKRRAWIGLALVSLCLCVGGLWMGGRWRQELTQAPRQMLRIFCQLEEGIGLTEELLAQAQHIFTTYPKLMVARLVWVQVCYRISRERGDQRLAIHAMDVLGNAMADDPQEEAYSALRAEMVEMSSGRQGTHATIQPEDGVSRTAQEWFVLSLATLDRNRALQCAERAVRLDDGHRLAWERLAWLYLTTGDHDRAFAASERLIELDDDSAYWVLFQSRVLLKSGQYEAAIKRLTAHIARQPAWFWYRHRALAYLCLEQFEEAIGDHTKASELHKTGKPWEQYHRATALWIAGHLEEAADDYRTFIASSNFPGYALARLFLVLHEQGNQREAGAMLADARSVVHDKWMSSIFACLALEVSPDELIVAANAAGPPDRERLCEAYYYAGEASLLLGRSSEAGAYFQKAVDTDLVYDPNNEYLDPMSEYHLARWRVRQLTNETVTASLHNGA